MEESLSVCVCVVWCMCAVVWVWIVVKRRDAVLAMPFSVTVLVACK